MIDIKVLTIRDLLQITNVEYAAIFPQSVIITGYKLDQTSQVLINDLESPEFVVESPSRLVAQVPTSERTAILRSVSAIADKPSVDRRSLLHFKLQSLRSLRGLERLVQVFCRLLLQTPGTDRFHPNEGGGLLKIIGKNISRTDNKTLQASVIGAVTRTRDQILARQAPKSQIPADERLLSATTEAVGFDVATTTLACRVALSAVSGRLAVTNIVL